MGRAAAEFPKISIARALGEDNNVWAHLYFDLIGLGGAIHFTSLAPRDSAAAESSHGEGEARQIVSSAALHGCKVARLNVRCRVPGYRGS